MSREEDLFKQHLDDMLSSQQFEMGADNWSGMEKLLNQQQRKRRGFFILFSGLGVLLLGTLAWLFMPAAEQTANKVASTPSITIQNKVNDEPAASVAPAAKAPATEQTKPAKNTLKHITTTVPATQKTKALAPNEPSTAAPVKSAITKVPSPAPALASAPNSDAVPEQQVLSNTTSKLNTPVGTTNTSDESIDRTTDSVAPNNEILNATQAVTTGGISSVPMASTVTAQPTTVAVPENSNNSTPVTAVTDTNENAGAVQDSVVSKPILKLDSIAPTAIAAKPDTDYVAKKHLRFALEAGISAISGWKVDNTRDAAGINPLAGAHLFYPLSSELDVSIGIQYTTVNNLGYSKYTATVSHLDLGRVDESTVFTPLRLHYVVMPLKFLMHVSPRQSIGAGINAAYLLTSDSRVETFTYGYNSSTRTSSQIKKGYTQGFRNFDAQVAAYYTYKLSKKFEAQACLMYGLMDVKTGEALPSKGFERNSGGKISLFYSLFEK